METLEKNIEKLKVNAQKTQKEIDDCGSSAGWSVLAALTNELNKTNEEIEGLEMRWMEQAERVEDAEVEIVLRNVQQ